MLLRSPQLNPVLITTTFGKAEYRAKIIARILTVAKHTHIPIGLGAGGRGGDGGQQPWVKDYDLKSYPGKLNEDGIQALIDAVEQAKEPLTIISIGPSPTVAAALERRPGIAAKAMFVGMQGSVRKGYSGGPVSAEWNVKADVKAAQRALLAPWRKMTITPLDTCGLVKVSGLPFQTLCESKDDLVKALIENYRIWAKNDAVKESSILFDTVAVYLAYPGPKPLVEFEELRIGVNQEGFTPIDPHGMPMTVAIAWKDQAGYEKLLVDTLLRKAP